MGQLDCELPINPGLPQGLPLSPVLFNDYNERIKWEQITGKGRILSYVDDMWVYRQDRKQGQIAGKLQTELDCIDRLCDGAGAMVNENNTFSHGSNHIVYTQTPTVNLFSETGKSESGRRDIDHIIHHVWTALEYGDCKNTSHNVHYDKEQLQLQHSELLAVCYL